MELTHRFVVPTPVEETWAHFQDIASVAECFPGAQVTSTEGDSFTGTCKVKLGPIALVYTGSGTFVERDEAARRFVVEAKGKDKRGNGTAGATVTLTMDAGAAGTEVQVATDLSITGKPAQFGRGVMQDVSDKLLGQFVACLEQRLAGPAEEAAPEPGPAPAIEAEPADEVREAPASLDGRSLETPASKKPATQPAAGPASSGDAVDLGATVLPVLLKTYGKQLAAAVLGLLVVGWLVRRLLR